jgi:hypothetical protein
MRQRKYNEFVTRVIASEAKQSISLLTIKRKLDFFAALAQFE